jgi:proline iminopeptidase
LALSAGALASLALPSTFADAATAAPARTGFAPVPAGKVWYRVYGSGPKTPILTLHGGPGAAHNYLLPLRALADERPIIFYDQLGCGLSDAPHGDGPYHIARFVAEVDAVRKALGLERVILYGHSWGTMLAIEYFATGHGAGVEKLIMGGALASVPQAVEGQFRMIAALPNGAGPRLLELERSGHTRGTEYEKLVDLFYKTYVLRTKPTPDTLASFAYVAKSPAYAIMNGPNEFTITGNLKHWDRRKDLGSITVPTLLLTGQYDEVSLACHETIHHGVRGSRLEVIPNCSHMAMQEAPADYVRRTRAFLA